MSFKRFDTEDIVVSAEAVTAPVWSTDAPTLSTFYTSSNQEAASSGDYYLDVYQTGSALTDAAVQFAIAYGDKVGSGSAYYNGSVAGKSPSSTIYGQYRSLVLGDEDLNFTFGEKTSEYFYAISIDRARYKEKLLPATLNLKLTVGSGTLYLTDNSKDSTTVTFVDSGRVYEIVSGSNGSAYSGTGYTISGSYGKFLPDVGLLLLNGKALDLPVANGGLALSTGRSANTDANNNRKLFNAIVTGASFKLNSEETITSNYVFTRIRNGEFNYSNNPSNITGSGELRHSTMINSPQAYITTVGLYNDNNDLVAVAKMSTPLLKDFTKEALIRIKLDF